MTPTPPASPAPPAPFRIPLATTALIAVNVGLWVLQIATGVPLSDPPSSTLVAWGGNLPLYTLTGDTWRLFTAMFLHIGIVHLGLNMYVLAFTAPQVEKEFGAGRMLAIYVAGGLLASCASVLWGEMRSTPENPIGLLTVSAGASGAVMALFGSLLAGAVLPMPRFAHLPPAQRPGIHRGLVQAIVINICAGFAIHGVDNAAHVGGTIGGFALGVIMAIAPGAAGARAALARYAAVALLVGVCVGALLHATDQAQLMSWRAELDASPPADR